MIFEIEIGQIREEIREIRSKIRIRNLVRITETGYYNLPTLQKFRPRNFVKLKATRKDMINGI